MYELQELIIYASCYFYYYNYIIAYKLKNGHNIAYSYIILLLVLNSLLF